MEASETCIDVQGLCAEGDRNRVMSAQANTSQENLGQVSASEPEEHPEEISAIPSAMPSFLDEEKLRKAEKKARQHAGKAKRSPSKQLKAGGLVGSSSGPLPKIEVLSSPFAMNDLKKRQVDFLAQICREGYDSPMHRGTYFDRKSSVASQSTVKLAKLKEKPTEPRKVWDTASTMDRASLQHQQSTTEVRLEREEMQVVRKKREATQQGKAALVRLDKLIQKGDFDGATNAAQEARSLFQKAQDIHSVVDVDALQVKLTGEQILQEVQLFRAKRDYAQCLKLIAKANENYSILADISVVRQRRSGNQRDADLLYRDRNFYQQFSNPLATVRAMAIEDGTHARSLSAKALAVAKYSAAKSHLEVAQECFNWAMVPDEQTGIQELIRAVEVAETRNVGDSLVEKVANVLEPIVPKDFPTLFIQLNEAAAAYTTAGDEEGVTLVRRVRATAYAIRVADRAWQQMTQAIKGGHYGSAVGHLSFVRSQLAGCGDNMPGLNPVLARMIVTLLQPGGEGLAATRQGLDLLTSKAAMGASPKSELTSYQMIEEFALADGLRHCNVAEAHINEDPPAIDKADQALQGAYKCLRWVLSTDNEKAEVQGEVEAPMTLEDSDSEGDEYSDESVRMGQQVLSTFMKLFGYSSSQARSSTAPTKASGAISSKTPRLIQKKTLHTKATEALERVESLSNKVKCAQAVSYASTLMDLYKVELNRSNIPEALQLLNKVYEVYSSHNLNEEAQKIEQMRTSHLADKRVEEVEDLIKKKKFGQAIFSIDDAISKFDKAGEKSRKIKAEKKKKEIMAEEVMLQMEAQIEVGNYDTALAQYKEGLRLLHEAESKSGLKRWGTRSALDYVADKAYQEGERFKLHALQAIQLKELADARSFSLRARKCFEWANMLERSGIDVVDTAIEIAKLFWEGEDLYTNALDVLDGGDRARSIELVREAKALFSEARVAHVHLSEISTKLMSSQHVQNAIILQEHINEIYSTSIDLSMGAEAEGLFHCLEADSSLDTLGILLSNSMIPDALAMLSKADSVYQQSRDSDRRSKASKLTKFVHLHEVYFQHLQQNDFDSAVDQLSSLQALAEELRVSAPFSIITPEGAEWTEGREAHTAVKDKATEIGRKHLLQAAKKYDEKQYPAALSRLNQAGRAFEWVAKSEKNGNWEEETGITFLQEKIMAGSAQAEGEEFMKKGNQCLEKSEFEEAIKFFTEAVNKFGSSRLDARKQEAGSLVAITRGMVALQKSDILNSESKFDECLAMLDAAFLNFKDGGNKEKQQEITKRRAKIRGDQVMLDYQPFLEARKYDKAVQTLLKASSHYVDFGDPKLVLTEERAHEQVAVIARRDGEKYKNKANFSLSQKRSEEARQMIEDASESFRWVGADLKAVGVMNIIKDLEAIELKEKAEKFVKDAFTDFTKKMLVDADNKLQEAQKIYRSVEAFSLVNQVNTITLCLNGDKILEEFAACNTNPEFLRFLEALTEVEEVYSSAQTIKGPVYGGWPSYLSEKMTQVEDLVLFLKGCAQISDSNIPPGKALNQIEIHFQKLEKYKDKWLLPFSFTGICNIKEQFTSTPEAFHTAQTHLNVTGETVLQAENDVSEQKQGHIQGEDTEIQTNLIESEKKVDSTNADSSSAAITKSDSEVQNHESFEVGSAAQIPSNPPSTKNSENNEDDVFGLDSDDDLK